MLNFRFLSACSNLPYRTCILLVILALCGLIRSQQCYTPNGLKSGDTPCPQVSSDPHFTFCCAHDHTCSSNLLCITGLNPRTYARGSCTDSSWRSPSCPLFCQTNAKTSGIGVTSCGSGTWCCDLEHQDKDNTCCENAANLFFLEEARMNQSSSTSSSPTASGSLFSVSSVRNSSSATTLASSTSTSAPSALPASAKAGIGVGVPVAVALFVLLIYLVIRNKRLRARIQDPSADGTNHLKEEMMSGHQKQMTLTPYELTNDTRRHELGEPQRHEMGLS